MPGPAPEHRFLSAGDVAFLAAAVARIVVRDGLPSGSADTVVRHIDRQLAQTGDHGEPAALYRECLDAIASHDAGRSFPMRPPEWQDHFLHQLEAGHWMLQRVPSAVFFKTLRAHALEGALGPVASRP